jgi:hypothetical protein
MAALGSLFCTNANRTFLHSAEISGYLTQRRRRGCLHQEWRPGDIFPVDRLGERPGRLRGRHPRGDADLPVACRQRSPDGTA